MQDMIRSTGDHGYFQIDNGLDGEGRLISNELGGYVCLKESESSFRAYHPDFLFQSFFSAGSGNGLPSISCQPEGTIGSSRGLYDRLATPLTTRVRIERNPFDTEFSVWYLANDLRELPKLLAGTFKAVASLRKLRYRTHVLALPFRDVMDATLAHKFGYVPSFADLRDFIALVKRWATHLITDGSMTGFYTFRKPIKEIEPGSVFERSYNFQDGNCSANIRMRYQVHALRHYMLVKYYFVCPELHGLLAYVKKAADELGLLDPAAAWDRLKFSFITDWFIDIGGWLHKHLKPHWYPVDLVVSDWAETLIRDTDYVGYITCVGPDTNRINSDRDCWTNYVDKQYVQGVFHQYARKRQFPAPLVVDKRTMEASLRKSLLRVNRIIIGACLVGQGSKVQYRHYLSGRYIKRARIN